jgi:hypothetical protein
MAATKKPRAKKSKTAKGASSPNSLTANKRGTELSEDQLRKVSGGIFKGADWVQG